MSLTVIYVFVRHVMFFNKSAIFPFVHWAVEFPLTLQECGKSTLRLIYDYSIKCEMSELH